MLTKSLHTVTAATRVASYLWALPHASLEWTSGDLAQRALAVLGYASESDTDPVVVAITKNCAKIMEASSARHIESMRNNYAQAYAADRVQA
jgi:hypothetical protein